MQIVVIKPEKLYKYEFPTDNVSTYWIQDLDNNSTKRDLISIKKVETSWILESNETCYIDLPSGRVNNITLSMNAFYPLTIVDKNNKTSALLYIYQENDESFASYEISDDGVYTIGSGSGQKIIIQNEFIADSHAELVKDKNGYTVKAVDQKYGVYVNNCRVTSAKHIENGDSIFILGFTFTVLNEFVFINNYNRTLMFNTSAIQRKEMPQYTGNFLPTEEDDSAVLYSESDYYSRQPRFITALALEDVKIDNPPGKSEPDDTPVLYTIGPMLTMTMSSAVSISTSIMNLMNGEKSLMGVLPALLISGAMILSTILWPSLLKKYNKKKLVKNEQDRQKKYNNYLVEKKNKIAQIKHNQHQALLETFPEPKDLPTIIMNKRRDLWERKIESDDFLDVRVGLGSIPLKINLSYSEEGFSMIEDNLKESLNRLTEASKEIPNAPVIISLTRRNKLVLIGDKIDKELMLKSIILQLVTFHSYDDLKLVFMIDDTSSDLWESLKILPHVWSDARDIRFYANNYDDMTKISYYLEQVFTARKNAFDEDNSTISSSEKNKPPFKSVQPYYLVIVDNIKKQKNVELIDKILKEPKNLGFGLIIMNDGISKLPNECNHFLTADGKNSAIITNELNEKNQTKFAMDDFNNINLPLLCEKLSNIPIKRESVLNDLTESIGFLEMYKVGRIEQLNILDRWEKSNPVNSLSVPIGIRTDGETFTLDLHEKFHGPHGLIAGMTGSGKSEFIITYILSMCINYSPDEVSFVLIDYKGGGLTGAFENKLTGVKLPHLAGTITNLDKAEINRALSSIQSELKRRQELFNKAKLALNESTLDIYKYQQLYRDGKIEEPVSHLFIISDEFAELKSQQTEFMQELISTARIGRSLGVHLILATQKPSGIVDDQIWSNSKFKVCLKVQERADSMDVIKCPDAVTLKQAGRFYLQVGYNDFFAMGQSAYSGTKYVPKDKIAKTVDRDVTFINDIGDAISNVATVEQVNQVSYGEELPNILKYIYEAAQTTGVYARKLWLDKIPAEIFVTNLMRKYSFVSQPWDITAVVGEYDDPNNQSQGLLTIDFNQDGNTIVYGATGKEIMISSIIYSLIINHSSDELNIYVLDFGSEMFGIFSQAPQVGDVVFINEQEKIVNLFSTVTKELEKRKKLFSDYNGDYNIYIKNSGQTLPRIIIIINNYETFSETYEDYINVVSSLSREGERYGITFVISASGVNAVRGKTTQNFSNMLCLQFNDDMDYASVLGPTHGMIPSNIEGRGLVKIDNVIHEFQTAYPYKWDEINVFIRNICNQLQEKVKKKAETIAVLPNHVRLEDISNRISDIKLTPIGIVKDTLEVSTFNFNKSPISLISAQDSSMLDRFVPSLGKVFQNMYNVELYLIDAGEIVKDPASFRNYYTTSNATDLLKVLDGLKNENVEDRTYIFMFLGIEQYISSLSPDEQRLFKADLAALKNVKNIKAIIADAVAKIKMYEYEEFYRNCTQPINAIWIGSGITDQYTIKSSTYNKETRSQIPSDFGYNVDRGVARQIKVLDFYTRD